MICNPSTRFPLIFGAPDPSFFHFLPFFVMAPLVEAINAKYVAKNADTIVYRGDVDGVWTTGK